MRIIVSIACLALLPAVALADGGSDPGKELADALRSVAQPMVKQLSDSDLAVRRKAIEQLGRLGPAADWAAGDLLKAARESAVRDQAVRALSQLGPTAAGALVAAMNDNDPWFRIAAIRALAGMADCPADASLISRLAEQFTPDNPAELRIASADLVRKIAPKLANRPELALTLAGKMLATLDKPEKGTQAATAAALAALGQPAVPMIISKLEGRNAAGMLAAAEAVALIGPPAGKSAEVLIEWLDSEQWRFRLAAAEALGALGESAKPAVPKLVELAWVAKLPEPAGDASLTERAGPTLCRQAAERALIRLGKSAEPALPHVLAALDDPQSPRRLAAIETLAAIGPKAEHIALLIRLVRDPRFPATGAVAAAVAAAGEPAGQAAIEMLNTPDAAVQLAGAAVVARLGPKAGDALKVAIARISATSTTARVRLACVEALSSAGSAAAAGIDPLVKLIREEQARAAGSADYDPTLMNSAFTALGSMGAPAVQPLTVLLAGKDPVSRRQAAMALRMVGKPPAEAAIDALAARLSDPDPIMGMTLSVVLGDFGPAALPVAKKALASDQPIVRARAAELVGRIGPAAAASTDRLVELLADKDAAVRSSAAWALGRLGPDVLARPAVRAALLARFDDTAEQPSVRAAAATSVAAAANPSAEFVRSLGGLINDPAMRNAALDALKTIGTASASGQ